MDSKPTNPLTTSSPDKHFKIFFRLFVHLSLLSKGGQRDILTKQDKMGRISASLRSDNISTSTLAIALNVFRETGGFGGMFACKVIKFAGKIAYKV